MKKENFVIHNFAEAISLEFVCDGGHEAWAAMLINRTIATIHFESKVQRMVRHQLDCCTDRTDDNGNRIGIYLDVAALGPRPMEVNSQTITRTYES